MAIDEDDPPKHVRRERATREHYGNDAVDAHPRYAIAWCGENASGQWYFQDAGYVLETLAQETCIIPCPACLLAMRTILDIEIGDRPQPEAQPFPAPDGFQERLAAAYARDAEDHSTAPPTKRRRPPKAGG